MLASALPYRRQRQMCIRDSDGLNPDVHIELSPLGRIAEQALLQMDGLLHYVIMPNHIHFLVGIQPKADGTMQASSPTNISQVVRTETDYWAIVQ